MTDTMKGRSERVDLRMTPAAKRTRQTAADRRVFELDQKHRDAFTGAWQLRRRKIQNYENCLPAGRPGKK
jgi:hypothetical protein